MRADRCPACGRRPRRATPRILTCDYCNSRWRRTPVGPADFEPSAQARWAIEAGGARPPIRSLPITLGVLADNASLHTALSLAETIGNAFTETVILLDAGTAPTRPLPQNTSIHARPLAGHFGAQRSALQRLVRTPWVLQLDTDETVDAPTLTRLPMILRAAERDGVLALGVPRRNLVDGALSDHYPDPQYRLCRRTVSYEGQVHERPHLASRARQSRLALGLHIDHHLTRERVLARTNRYDAMSDGATDTARRPDERALLTPFRA